MYSKAARAKSAYVLSVLLLVIGAGCSKESTTQTQQSTTQPAATSAVPASSSAVAVSVGNPDLPPAIMKDAAPFLKPVAGKSFQIGFAQSNFGESWRAAMDNSMKDAAATFPDLQLQLTDGQQSNSVQASNIETFITQKKDLIIVSPNEAAALTPSVSKAFAAGIPVILLDRNITNDNYTVFMGADNLELGKKAGAFIVKALAGKPGQIVELGGIPDASATKDRHDGAHSILDKQANITFVDQYPCNYVRDQAVSHMENLLQSQKQFNVVLAHNDDMALGAIQVLKKNGRKGVIVVGFDGKADAIKAIMDGDMSATFTYPYMGKASMQLAQAILHGYKPPKHISFPSTQVDATNAAKYYNPKGYL